MITEIFRPVSGVNHNFRKKIQGIQLEGECAMGEMEGSRKEHIYIL
jgi:hypothetical protein